MFLNVFALMLTVGLLLHPLLAVPLTLHAHSLDVIRSVSECGPMDVVLTLPASGKMEVPQWNQAKTFVKQLAAELTGARVAVVVYSTEATVAIPFDSTDSIEMLQRLVDGIIYVRGELNMDSALTAAAQILSPNPSVPRVAVLLTDSKDEGKTSLAASVAQLNSAGVQTLIIAVGSKVEKSELQKAGAETVIRVSSYDELMQQSVQLGQRVCNFSPQRSAAPASLPVTIISQGQLADPSGGLQEQVTELKQQVQQLQGKLKQSTGCTSLTSCETCVAAPAGSGLQCVWTLEAPTGKCTGECSQLEGCIFSPSTCAALHHAPIVPVVPVLQTVQHVDRAKPHLGPDLVGALGQQWAAATKDEMAEQSWLMATVQELQQKAEESRQQYRGQVSQVSQGKPSGQQVMQQPAQAEQVQVERLDHITGDIFQVV